MYRQMVLVVDDDKGILDYYRKLFAAGGDDLDIMGAAPAAEENQLILKTYNDPLALINEYTAIRSAGEQCPVCIFDMRMPSMSGLEAARRIRAIDPLIEVVIATAYADAGIDEMRKTLDNRLYFFRKPFAPEEFMLLVNSLVKNWNGRKALESREEQFRTIAENMADLVLVVEPNGRCVFASSSAESLLGYQSSQIVGRSLYEFVHPDDREIILSASEDFSLVTTVRSLRECRFMRQDHAVIWMEVSVNPLSESDGTVEKVQLVARDVSERRVHEERLLEQQSRISEFINSTHTGVWDWNILTGEAVLSNSWAGILGYISEELAPMTIDTVRSLCHPDDLPRIQKLMQEHFSHHDSVYECESRLRHKDGRWVWVLDHGRVVEWTSGGEPLRMSGTTVDIDGRKNAEQQLKASTEKLELETARAESLSVRAQQAARAKSEFLSNMNHELRTPLNGIISMTSLLMETPLSEDQRQYLDIIRVSGESMLSIVNDIFDYSTIAAGRIDLEDIDFDFRLSMEDAVEIIAFKGQEKGLQVNMQIDPSIPVKLRGDAGRLRQIIMNIGGNAVKFTPAGSIRLSASLVKDGGDAVEIQIVVEDTGIGIPEDKMPFLFMPFFQVDAALSRQYGGTGLGLPIAQQLAQKMGGSVTARSVLGRGSTFTVVVVLKKQPVDLSAAAEPDPSFDGVNVLILDRKPLERSAVRALLERRGCLCQLAGDVDQALGILDSAASSDDSISFVLVDNDLGSESGFDAGCRIAAARNTGNPSMILMVDVGRRGDSQKARQIGFDGYLLKPLRQDILFGCMSLVLDRRESGVGGAIVTRHSVAELRRDQVRILLRSKSPDDDGDFIGALEGRGYRTLCVDSDEMLFTEIRSNVCSMVVVVSDAADTGLIGVVEQIREISETASRGYIPVVALLNEPLLDDRERCLAAGVDDFIDKSESAADVVVQIEARLKRARRKVGNVGGGHGF